MSTNAHRQSRHPARRLASGAVNILLLVAALIGLGYLAPTLLGYERYVITGGSMSGTFEKGSIAFEKPVPVEDLRVGDVITYQPPADSGVTTLVTHRIVTSKQLDTGQVQYRTQGDANPDPDPWTFALTDRTQPVVRHTVPHVGWVMVGLADPDVRRLVIGVPAGLIALASLAELGNALRPRRRRPRVDAVEPAPVALPREHAHV